MKFLRLVVLSFLFICCGMVSFIEAADPVDEQRLDTVHFRWAFGALVGAKNSQQLVSIRRDTTLKTGDQLQMFVALHKACAVYVIYYSAEGDMALLFPYDGKQPVVDYKTSTPYYIPKDRSWFALDENTGRETFYLLASAKRLTDLESLLNAYAVAESSEKSDLGERIRQHIRKLKRQHRKVVARPERPVSIGGNVRGEAFDIASLAVEIRSTDFYSKTFTIDHKE